MNGVDKLKKYSKIAYIVLILIIFLSGFFIYKVSGKDASNEDSKSKVLSEVKHLENQFQNLFNKLNNISFENYKISSTEIKEEQSNSQSSENSSGSGGENSGQSGNSSDSKSSNESADSSKNNKQYKLEKTGILTKDSQIEWSQIKNDVEDLYMSLYPITLDLYQTNVNQQDIINFNKEYDNLTKSAKNENKEETLMELALLYDYLPKFIENCADNEKDIAVIKTKNNIFKAYSILDKEDWATISGNIDTATQEITKLITNVNNQGDTNQYNINKAYVMVNELQNAVLLRDKEVFLIKYKNLLEELQNI